MNKIFNCIALWAIAVSSLSAQSTCANNLFANGGAEQGTPYTWHQDIDQAVDFARIWASNSWADYYAATVAPGSYTPPAPATGNYVACWIARSSHLSFREGFRIRLATPVMPNTGIHTLSLDAACLDHGWGGVMEAGLYAVYNPNDVSAPNPPTTSLLPLNVDLYGSANTSLLGAIPFSVTNINKQQYTFQVNTSDPNFPAGGMTHLMVTRLDNTAGGAAYVAFDNFCMTAPIGCAESDVVNHNLDLGTPTSGDQDIANATGFDRLWSPGSWADFYNASSSPFSTPVPADGNYVGCWIVHGSRLAFREGFKVEMDFTLPPNTGTHTLSFEMACLHRAWGDVEVGFYALHNPSGNDAPSPPTSPNVPSNLDLYGTSNTHLLGAVAQSGATCTPNKQQYSISINTNDPSFPAGGMTHLMVTRNDGGPSGGIYMGFDNFCLTVDGDVCSGSYATNGNLEQGVPSSVHQDIDNAAGFRSIWQYGSLADYYTATAGPFTPPAPADGNYASCWIANFRNGGTTYREGFQNELVAPILANTGVYALTFDMACLSGWGNAEVGVYAVHNPVNSYGSQPTGAFTPANTALFGAGNTFEAGIIPISAAACTNTKQSHTVYINTNDPNFPAGGMTHFFVTHSDRATGINGALYMGFDNFCLRSANSNCAVASIGNVTCTPDVDGDDVNDHILWLQVAGDQAGGSLVLTSSCGSFANGTVALNGSGSYSVTLAGGANCTNLSITYQVLDAQGNVCNSGLWAPILPACVNPCVCGKGFVNSVNAGYQYRLTCPYQTFTPVNLNDCDQVQWYEDGHLIQTTQGNAPFRMRHRLGYYEICMVVTRVNPITGTTCRHRYCEERLFNQPCMVIGGSGLNLQVRPNPVRNRTVLTWRDAPTSATVNVQLYNLSGQRVQTLTNINGYDQQVELDLSKLPQGVYLARLEGEGYRSEPIKIVVQR